MLAVWPLRLAASVTATAAGTFSSQAVARFNHLHCRCGVLGAFYALQWVKAATSPDISTLPWKHGNRHPSCIIRSVLPCNDAAMLKPTSASAQPLPHSMATLEAGPTVYFNVKLSDCMGPTCTWAASFQSLASRGLGCVCAVAARPVLLLSASRGLR